MTDARKDLDRAIDSARFLERTAPHVIMLNALIALRDLLPAEPAPVGTHAGDMRTVGGGIGAQSGRYVDRSLGGQGSYERAQPAPVAHEAASAERERAQALSDLHDLAERRAADQQTRALAAESRAAELERANRLHVEDVRTSRDEVLELSRDVAAKDAEIARLTAEVDQLRGSLHAHGIVEGLP